MTVQERVKPAETFQPEVASLNMGSMNFALYPMLERFKTFSHEWEQPYLESSRDRVFKNTFKDIRYILESCGDNETRFEIECYDIGHLYTLAHFLDRKHGGWHEELTEDLKPAHTLFAGKGDIYHALQACLIPLYPAEGSITKGIIDSQET